MVFVSPSFHHCLTRPRITFVHLLHFAAFCVLYFVICSSHAWALFTKVNYSRMSYSRMSKTQSIRICIELTFSWYSFIFYFCRILSGFCQCLFPSDVSPSLTTRRCAVRVPSWSRRPAARRRPASSFTSASRCSCCSSANSCSSRSNSSSSRSARCRGTVRETRVRIPVSAVLLAVVLVQVKSGVGREWKVEPQDIQKRV